MTLRRKRLVVVLIVSALVVLLGWLVSGHVRAWYHHRQAQAALAHRDFPLAREHLSRCNSLAPSDPEYLLLAAQAARRDGDFAEADRLLGQARAAKADPETLRVERQLASLQQGDLQDADQFLALCLERPNLPGGDLVLEALVLGSLRAMNLPLARRCTDMWMERASDPVARAQGLIWRGDEAIRRGSHEQALADYREALALDPGSDQARQRAAEILVRTDPGEALDLVGRLRRSRPNDRALRLLEARGRRALGEHEEARELLDGLLRETSDDAAALLERGQIDLDLRKTDLAEGWFRRAEALAPEMREPKLALARCLQVAGKDAEAREYRQRVERLDAELQKRIDKLFPPSPK